MHTDRQQIVELESRFWQSMVDKDTAASQAMLAEQCLVTGPHGAMKIDPGMFAQMMCDGKWTLETFELSDVDVVFPTEDVAVIAYKVRETGMMDGGPMDMTCADASTWVREGGDWKCTLHTETIIDDHSASTRH